MTSSQSTVASMIGALLLATTMTSCGSSGRSRSQVGGRDAPLKATATNTNHTNEPTILDGGLDDEPEPNAPVDASGLSLQQGKFTDSNGMKSDYIIQVPNEMSAHNPFGLLLYFHGDGGAANFEASLASMAGIPEMFNLMPVAIRSPAGGHWWEPQAMEKASFIHELIQDEILKKYDVDVNMIFTAGQSSGASFITGFFLPTYGYLYHGGHVLLCGGTDNMGHPFLDFVELVSGALYFETQTGDFIFEQAKEGAEFYEANGFTVKTNFSKGNGHCNFDLAAALTTGLSALTEDR